MKKRILGLLVAMCLIIGLLPVTAFAVEPGSITAGVTIVGTTYTLVNDGSAKYFTTNGTGTVTATNDSVNYNIALIFPSGSDTLEVYFKDAKMSLYQTGNTIQIGTTDNNSFNAEVIVEGTESSFTQTKNQGSEYKNAIIRGNLAAGYKLTFRSVGEAKLTLDAAARRCSPIRSTNEVLFTNANIDISVTKSDYNQAAIWVANSVTVENSKLNVSSVVGVTFLLADNHGDNDVKLPSTRNGAYNLKIQNGSVVTLTSTAVNGLMVVNGSFEIDRSAVTIVNTHSSPYRIFTSTTGGLPEGEEIKFPATNRVAVRNATVQMSLNANGDDFVVFDPATVENYSYPYMSGQNYNKYFATVPVAAEPEPTPEANFDKTQLILEDDITVNFRADKAAVVAAGGTQVKTQIGDNAAEYITLTDAMVSGDYYVVPFTGVAAKQMGETVSMTICDAEGNPVGQTKTDSVLAYALRMLGEKPDGHTDDQYAALKVLLADMLNYGAMAQGMFDYDEDNLVTNDLTLQGTEEMKPVEAKAAATDAEGYLGTSFVLNNNIAMAMALDASVIGKTCTAKVTYKNYLGDDVVAENIVADATSTDNTTVFIFNGLVAADGRCEVTWEFYEGETLKLTVTDSMEAYVGRMIGKYPELTELMKYSDAAETYFLLMK